MAALDSSVASFVPQKVVSAVQWSCDDPAGLESPSLSKGSSKSEGQHGRSIYKMSRGI